MRMMRKSVAHATGMHGFFSGKHESESDSDHTSPLIGPPGSSVTRSGSVVIPIARATSPPGPDEVKEVDAQGPRSLAAAMENAAADNSPLPARQRFSSAARDTQQSALSLQSARSSQSALAAGERWDFVFVFALDDSERARYANVGDVVTRHAPTRTESAGSLLQRAESTSFVGVRHWDDFARQLERAGMRAFSCAHTLNVSAL